MKFISSTLLLVTLSLSTACFSANTNENDQAKPWLERLSQSLKQLNFSTSFVVVKNNQAEPYHWFHGVNELGKELEILALLNGPRKDILRKDNIVSYIEPEFPPYSVESPKISGPIPSILSGDISLLEKSYDFISVGRSRVLGRSAQLIRIVSKDQHRFGYWLWLDKQSGLLLKLALITRKGKLLEQVQFTHLEITDTLSENLIQLQSAELPQVIDLYISDEANELGWSVNWLPKGFKKLKSNRHRISATKQPVEFMLFNDGLVDLSVYVSKSADKQRAVEYVFDGGTVVLNQVVNGFEVSVVGKIPVNTAKAIADSVSINQKTSP